MTPPTEVTRWQRAVSATLSRLHLSLDASLVLAICWKESSGNPWAGRPEPGYKWLMNVRTWKPFRPLTPAEISSRVPPDDFACLAGSPTQEWWAQQESFGLMQIMGAAAREAGFRGLYLNELFDPFTNLEFGILHFWNYALSYGNREKRDGLQRYNGGGDPGYADDVLAKMKAIQDLPIMAQP